MSRYRKKPVVIDAIHYDGTFPLDFLGRDESVRMVASSDGTHAIEIQTLEGTMRANVGDWIIRGVQGEVYPCKPDIYSDELRDILVNTARELGYSRPPVEGKAS